MGPVFVYLQYYSFQKKAEREKEKAIACALGYYLLPIANPSGSLTSLARVRVWSYKVLADPASQPTKVEVPCLGIG